MSFICKVNGCRRTLPFPTLAYLKRHQRDVHEVKRVVCEACGWRFSRQQHLRDHLASTHPSRGCPGRRTMSTNKEAANAPKGDVRRQPNGAAPSVPAQVSKHHPQSSSASPAEIEHGAAAGKASAASRPTIRQTQRCQGQGRYQPYSFSCSKKRRTASPLAGRKNTPTGRSREGDSPAEAATAGEEERERGGHSPTAAAVQRSGSSGHSFVDSHLAGHHCAGGIDTCRNRHRLWLG